MVARVCMFLLVLGTTGACGSTLRSEDPGKFVCEVCLGPLAASGTAVEVASPYWTSHRLFKLINYTWPHIPGCYVALGPDREVLPLAGQGDRIETDDPVANFNRIAVREGLSISKEKVGAYMRFFAECYVASFSSDRYSAKEGAFSYRDWTGRVTRYNVSVHENGTITLAKG